MRAFKCKQCGGNIKITSERYGICDSCGCETILPRINDDKRAVFYERGNNFRQKCEFDKAYSAFEYIMADDPTDAEIHWCLTLCRYGVEYVKDARNGVYKPTIHRMQKESILEDLDYLAVMENSDENTKQIFRAEATKIARIQDKYLEIARNQKPYDVFICFKATDENNRRTEDSVIAQNIYEALTDRGIHTFFSKISLMDVMGEEYEPYIFSALQSSKIMVLVGTKSIYWEEPWVKNEWSRFLELMSKDRGKQIIPVYQGLEPEEIPKQIPSYYKVDISQTGAMQDLVLGIRKIIGEPAKNEFSNVHSSDFLTGQKKDPRTEVEKRRHGTDIISEVKVIGATHETDYWPKHEQYSDVIDMDVYPTICFHAMLKEPLGYDGMISVGYTVYDDNNNEICVSNMDLEVKSNYDRFSSTCHLRNENNIYISPGKYRAEYWVGNSKAVAHDFRVISSGIREKRKNLEASLKRAYGVWNLISYNEEEYSRGLFFKGFRCHCAYVKKDGTVEVIGKGAGNEERLNTGNWRDIIQVTTLPNATIGLRKDGKVLYAGSNLKMKQRVESYENVKDIMGYGGKNIGYSSGWVMVEALCVLTEDNKMITIYEDSAYEVPVDEADHLVFITRNMYSTEITRAIPAAVLKNGDVIIPKENEVIWEDALFFPKISLCMKGAHDGDFFVTGAGEFKTYHSNVKRRFQKSDNCISFVPYGSQGMAVLTAEGKVFKSETADLVEFAQDDLKEKYIALWKASFNNVYAVTETGKVVCLNSAGKHDDVIPARIDI